MKPAPEPLREIGLERARDNSGGRDLDLAGAIWKHFGRELDRRFRREAGGGRQGTKP